ncbi:proton-conducting transporter membrane subunit [Pelovirga terrestris]|uniref:Hydrogenase n=1 Tax=Pelovirga terrestris TaxID=2771352 RepID=A0A8J6UHJ9_9BACT|nr:proton-conducting transporter membrane subunit [Pelovirga terrestris]MBD1401563.1 hydrogenase [Pelovirga terrestris]
MLISLILIPVCLAALSLVLPWHQLRSWLLPTAGMIQLVLAVLVVLAKPQAGEWIGLDALSTLVLLVTSILYLGCAFYAVDYLALRQDRGNRIIVPCLLVFLAAMSLAIISRHLGLMWVAVETTTIVSAPLIYYNRNRLSIEATWKYLLLCSVGIALAMLGIMFVAYSAVGGQAEVSLQLDWLLDTAPQLSKPWLHAGFIFLLVGYGTKMGLAPLHSWKPDAYAESPALVGALLAGGLTTVSFLAILRGVQVMSAAGDLIMAQQALMGLGLFSMLIAAIFMVRQPDIKRMLAYSSVEHMGILALGVGIGGLATFGALLHLANNALTKGCLFLTAGNIQRSYASKNLREVRGALSCLPLSAGIFLTGFLAITGAPPFGPFLSEFTILRGIFAGGHPWIAAAFLILLATIFIGMGATVLSATQGESPQVSAQFRDRLLLVAPPLLLLALVLCLGIYMPDPLKELLDAGVALLEVTS